MTDHRTYVFFLATDGAQTCAVETYTLAVKYTLFFENFNKFDQQSHQEFGGSTSLGIKIQSTSGQARERSIELVPLRIGQVVL
jgi:hypothetical protein